MKYYLLLLFSVISFCSFAQNTDPFKTEIRTTDIEIFWKAFDAAKPTFNHGVLEKMYLRKGTKGVKDFTKGRIKNAENLSKTILAHPKYYESIRKSTESIGGMKEQIINSLVKLKALYPKAIFPPVYFVVGALSSGGTTSNAGLIIGAEMYGLTPETPKEELDDWLKTVLKSVDAIPHIVAHELIHFQQKYDGGSLLAACIKEGSADFIAELISGKHINQHVHDFANPKEKELWIEFKERMLKKDYTGWLYSASKGRPNDLGYWIGYKISKSYYDNMTNKQQAIYDILNIKDFEVFLEKSKYLDQFKN